MADFQVLGHITNIKHQQECVLIWIDEYKKGYRKQDGTIVDDKVLSWKCIFSGNASKRAYINKYFNRGMLVQVKGELMPYAIEQGEMVDGYSVFVQTINIACYPRQMIKTERKMIRESMDGAKEKPNIDAFNMPDF